MLTQARVAHLATASKDCKPSVVPICFVYSRSLIYSAIDEKPKTTANLRRLRNIAENPCVSFITDEYRENWQRLWYVILPGTATILLTGREHRMAIQSLRKKYPQYRTMRLEERPIIRIKPTRTIAWRSHR
ncbi:MAG TPA: TIGR03668 family PPOX class F420-dependent oxidoreductase [Candidatus Acidoferrales bacterium]|nr:TIGR03668 family PPOX class F420-dependent oxidoreductase [Candidatus Acidoferrales bacterium]